VDYKKEFVTIYESNNDVEDFKNSMGGFLKGVPLRPGMNFDEAMNFLLMTANQNYTAMLRFRLVDKEQRTFTAERFCFRGSIDDWIFLDGPDTLEKLLKRYVKLLGTDSFFDSPLRAYKICGTMQNSGNLERWRVWNPPYRFTPQCTLSTNHPQIRYNQKFSNANGTGMVPVPRLPVP
jgi:hypothetical protein